MDTGYDESESDAALMARSLTQPEAFTGIFDRYAAAIHRYLARRVGTEHAEDILSQTFLVAFETRHRYDPARAGVRPWLYGIATNLLSRCQRDEARLYRALARTGVDPDAPCHADGVAERVDAGKFSRTLAIALARMPAGDRDVLLLVAWAGLRYEEIALALDIPVGTVRSRLHRARSRLRSVLPAAGERTKQ